MRNLFYMITRATSVIQPDERPNRYKRLGLPVSGTKLVRPLLLGLGMGVSTAGAAYAEVVCSRAGSEFDFNGGYSRNVNTTTNMRAKLQNPDYFGPTGTAAPEALSFQTLSVLNSTSLAACDIYIGGGFEEGGSAGGILPTAEANALKTWSDSSDEHFIIGGCDRAGNQTCSIFGRTIASVDNSPLAFTGGTALDYNPITCGGTGGAPSTFGGASGDITELSNDARLADHTGADDGNSTRPPSVAGMAGVTTNFSGTLGGGGEFQASKYLFTNDADIMASSGNNAVGAGPVASSDNAIFVVNVFKFAMDAIKDRNAQPACISDYNQDADLAIALSPSTSSVSGGQKITLTATITHQSGSTVGDVLASIPVPAGFSFTSATGDGSYDSSTGEWTVGTVNAGTTTSIDIVITANGTSSAVNTNATAEIITANLGDRDSQPNAGFGVDDRNDGIADDDEASATLSVQPPPFTPGPGLANSVCSVDPATNPFQDIGLRWEHNDAGGTSPDASIDQTDIFASASTGSFNGGLQAQINSFDLNINAATVPSSYDPSRYIEYSFTTTNFGDTPAELTGFGMSHFSEPSGGGNKTTGEYNVAIAIDDDPTFGSPEILINEAVIDNTASNASVATAPSPQGQLLNTFGHYDANGTTVELAPSTTYKMRVYPYSVAANGKDNGQPFANVVLWDDFMPKAVSCGPTEDHSDAPTTGTAPDGANTNAYGTATHEVVEDIQLGATIDAEFTSPANADADGDDNTGINDDDGVTIPTLLRGQSATISVSVAQVDANDGYLQAWIDWNGNGDFSGPGERIALNLQSASAGTGTINIPVNVPSDAITNRTFARFRWSTTQNLDSTTAATDGEVEDYAVTVELAPPPSNGTINYANTGNGQYPGSIGLLDWRTSGLVDGPRNGDVVSFDLPGCRAGTLVATFSNVVNADNADIRDMMTWFDASAHLAYNGPGDGEAIHTVNDDLGFTIDWSMTVDGVTTVPDIVFFDAEATNSTNESLTATTNGDPWALIENAGGSTYTATGIGTQTLTITKTYLPSNSPEHCILPDECRHLGRRESGCRIRRPAALRLRGCGRLPRRLTCLFRRSRFAWRVAVR